MDDFILNLYNALVTNSNKLFAIIKNLNYISLEK